MAQDTSPSFGSKVLDTVESIADAYLRVLRARYEARFAAAQAQQQALIGTPERYRNPQARAGDYIPPSSGGGFDQRTLLVMGGLLLAGAAAWAILGR